MYRRFDKPLQYSIVPSTRDIICTLNQKDEEIKFDQVSIVVGGVFDTYLQHLISESTAKSVDALKLKYLPEINSLEDELKSLKEEELIK